MLECEASIADPSGTEAACEPLPTGPSSGAVLGNAAIPGLGTSGVTLVGTVVLGATAFSIPAMEARAVPPADFEVDV